MFQKIIMLFYAFSLSQISLKGTPCTWLLLTDLYLLNYFAAKIALRCLIRQR